MTFKEKVIYPILVTLVTGALTGIVSQMTDGSIVSFFGGITTVQTRVINVDDLSEKGWTGRCETGEVMLSCSTSISPSGGGMCGSFIQTDSDGQYCSVNACSALPDGQNWQIALNCAN